MASKLSSIEESLHETQDAIQRGSASLQVGERGSDSETCGTESEVGSTTKCDPIEKGIPVACAPVFNNVDTAWLKMIVEEMPEAYAR